MFDWMFLSLPALSEAFKLAKDRLIREVLPHCFDQRQ
jgi:hypothetical protein